MQQALIAIVSDHTDDIRNVALADVFNNLCEDSTYKEILKKFGFIFTGGTFRRIFHGERKDGTPYLTDSAKLFLSQRTIHLPSFEHGGVAILSYMIVEKKCRIMWSFQTPDSPHHLVSQNHVLRQMCDVYGVRRLINRASILEWLEYQYKLDYKKYKKTVPLEYLELKNGDHIRFRPAVDSKQKIVISEVNNTEKTLCIIVRDGLAKSLQKFLRINKKIFADYDKIIISKTTLDLKNEHPHIETCNEIGKGGLIDMAMIILFGRCDDIFFYDQREPNQTSELLAYSYQLVLSACKVNQEVKVKMNIEQVEEWASIKQELFKKKKIKSKTKQTSSAKVGSSKKVLEIQKIDGRERVFYNVRNMEPDKFYHFEWMKKKLAFRKPKEGGEILLYEFIPESSRG